jgi:hypothetical protein
MAKEDAMQNRDYDRDYQRDDDRNWRNGPEDWEHRRRGDDRQGDYATGRDRPTQYQNRGEYGASGTYGRGGGTQQGYRQDWQGQRQDDEYGRGSGGQRYGENWQGRSGAAGSMRGTDYEYRDQQYGGQQYGRGRDYGSYSGTSAQGEYGGMGYRSGTPMTTYSYTEYWLIPGPHTGKGPRGYQRDDERIREDVNHRLTQHGQIDASDIDVSVQNGEVTLHGTADDRQQKRLAEDIAEDVPGVRDVHNNIKVQNGGGGFIDKVKDALSPSTSDRTDTGTTATSTTQRTTTAGTTGTTTSRTTGTSAGTTTARRDVQ